MPKVAPWHARNTKVHHDNTDCYVGNKILSLRRLEGTGNKPLCTSCAQLNRSGR